MAIWLLKTSFGWCGLIIENNAIKELVLAARNKSAILKRINPEKSQLSNVIIMESSDRVAGCIDMVNALQNTKEVRLAKRVWKDLNQYFNGEKVDFWGRKILIPFPSRFSTGTYTLDLSDYSAFERKVYGVLSTVPYGTVRTYKWIAEKIGCPKACRAVGSALAKNPLPLIIPCHRIIKSDGKLGNFSAIGGVKLKERLLRLEGVPC